ncbi:MOXD1 homolog 2-like [Zootermopsis nevadensis]|uniref:MOXD1 homolog 2-like n=1 Tax=Zootermopsis nevadensis TaxID=136037 RepID=UPI000B8EBEA5|nr:MOXD1 homolog 2-like [Zootermopsis nevadensis]
MRSLHRLWIRRTKVALWCNRECGQGFRRCSVSRAEGAMAWTLAVLLTLAVGLGHVAGAHWTHSTDLDPNYSVFWTPGEEAITFEVQVRTLGYVGFGFSADGQMPGADIVTGWVRDNQVFFQVGTY